MSKKHIDVKIVKNFVTGQMKLFIDDVLTESVTFTEDKAYKFEQYLKGFVIDKIWQHTKKGVWVYLTYSQEVIK